MTTITTIQLYDILAQKIGKETAKTLVDYVDTKIDKSLEDKSKVLVTKEDIGALENRLLREMNGQLRWIIGIFVTQTLMILGIYAAMFLRH
jgi:hypothetical protein